MPMDFAYETNEVLGPRVVIQKFVVKSQPQRPRSACDGGDCRNAVASVPRTLEGRVTCRGPHAPPRGLQQKPAFIEKNQASLPFEALFLVAATIRDASLQCPPRCVRGLAARASADSSPADAAAAVRIPGDNPRRTVAGSCPALVGPSIHRAHIPNTACHESRQRSTLSAAGSKAWEFCPDEASIGVCFHASTRFSIGMRMKRWSPLSQPLLSTTYPSRRAWPQSFDGLRASRGFLVVSCTNCTKSTLFPIN